MSQETLADDQSYRVGAVRNIAFVAFPDVEMLDVCGPYDVFAFADRWLRKTGKADRPLYKLDVIAPQAGPPRGSRSSRIMPTQSSIIGSIRWSWRAARKASKGPVRMLR